MVAGRCNSIPIEYFGDLLHELAGHTVNDPGCIGMLMNVFDQEILLVDPACDRKMQIGTVKARDLLHRIMQTQNPDNIIRNRPGSCCRKCGNHRSARDFLQISKDPQVAWAEILSPLRDTMRLIHGNERDRKCMGDLQEALCFQAFGGCIQDPDASVIDLGQYIAVFLFRNCGIEIGCRDAAFDQCAYLIVHQGDQRCHNDRQTRKQHGRDLEADGFSGACGHDAQCIAATEYRMDQLCLTGTELRIAEIPL